MIYLLLKTRNKQGNTLTLPFKYFKEKLLLQDSEVALLSLVRNLPTSKIFFQENNKMSLFTGKNLLIFACGGLIVHFYHSRKNSKPVLVKKTRRKSVHDVIMFSDQGLVNRNSVHPGMDRILYYLNLPRHTVDLCMYLITESDLCKVLEKLNLRRVKVRVILDADMAYASKSCIFRLQKYCIEHRWMKSSNIMHHKFCLIDASTENQDASPLLMTGSLNWTKQAFNGNYENVMVTSQKDIVEGYRKEFERLWVLFKPIV